MVERKRRTAASKPAQDSTQDAAEVILEYERKRKRRARVRARRSRREAEKQHHAAMERMLHSIEVIKWCVLSISSVMVISLIVGLIVLNSVKNEVQRVKSEVEDIQREAELIREKIRHPLETIGGTLGRRLENNISGYLSGDDSE